MYKVICTLDFCKREFRNEDAGKASDAFYEHWNEKHAANYGPNAYPKLVKFDEGLLETTIRTASISDFEKDRLLEKRTEAEKEIWELIRRHRQLVLHPELEETVTKWLGNEHR